LNERDATLRRLKDECQQLVAELQSLLDTKQMLDAEIAIYRKMLEGEESRVGLRQMVEQVGGTGIFKYIFKNKIKGCKNSFTSTTRRDRFNS